MLKTQNRPIFYYHCDDDRDYLPEESLGKDIETAKKEITYLQRAVASYEHRLKSLKEWETVIVLVYRESWGRDNVGFGVRSIHKHIHKPTGRVDAGEIACGAQPLNDRGELDYFPKFEDICGGKGVKKAAERLIAGLSNFRNKVEKFAADNNYELIGSATEPFGALTGYEDYIIDLTVDGVLQKIKTVRENLNRPTIDYGHTSGPR